MERTLAAKIEFCTSDPSGVGIARLLLAVAVGALFAITVVMADDGAKPSAPGSSPSLDDQLLQDLDAKLLEGLDLPPLPGSTEPKSTPTEPEAGRATEPPIQPIDGEDIGSARPKQNPLEQIGAQMQTAQQLIQQRDTSDKTQQLQKSIVDALEQLVAMQKQRAANAESVASAQRRNRRPERDEGADRDNNSPARDSTTQVGTADKVETAPPTDRRELLEEIWGNLPLRVRQQMQNASVEQFLPKYEKLIEQYYKRLAEEGRNSP